MKTLLNETVIFGHLYPFSLFLRMRARSYNQSVCSVHSSVSFEGKLRLNNFDKGVPTIETLSLFLPKTLTDCPFSDTHGLTKAVPKVLF